MLYSSKHSAYW